MIKAVFFDLYHTLVRYEPPREELQANAIKELGVDAAPEIFRRPIVIADEFIYQEIAQRSLSQRSKEEQAALWAQYQRIVLREVGIDATDKLVMGLIAKMRDFKMKLVLYDDVVPTLTELANRGLLRGLISNIDRDINVLLQDIGVLPLLDITVTSLDAGCNKPNPEIFWKALRRAGVKAAEAIYVGDQYQIDVLGASKAGMKGILLDRGGYFTDITDCPRIRRLTEIMNHLG